jgi:hypothetical protein
LFIDSTSRLIAGACIAIAGLILLGNNFTMSFVSAEVCNIEITAPWLTDVTGRYSDEFRVGHQWVVASSLSSQCDREIPFVTVFEVRDSEGITVILNSHAGQLKANERTEVGIAWTLETPGQHQLRAFAISDFRNPEILTEVRTS